jgi:hypothetical protein
MKIVLTGKLIDFLKATSIIPYLGILLVFVFTFQIYRTGDDQALLYGLHNALGCLLRTPLEFPCKTGVGHFPIFQYLIAMPFKLSGFSDSSIKEFFAFFSVFWSLVAAGAFWRIGVISSGKSGGHLGLLLLLSGYLVWYMTATFNEAASFALLALLILSIVDRWPVVFVCFIAFFCTITKEIMFPFIPYFMFLSFYARELRNAINVSVFQRILKFIVEYKVVAIAVILGVVTNLGFNYFRFGSIQNLSNLDPSLFSPLNYVAGSFVYLFISPAAGLVFTWLSLCVLMLAPMIFLMQDRREVLIIALAIIGLIIANVGLAGWYAPFGWVAWGPRLTLPFLGAVGAIGLYLAAPKIIAYIQKRDKKIKRGVLIFLIIAISSLPNISVRLDQSEFYKKIFATTKVEVNSGISNFTVQSAGPSLYQDATHEAYARNVIVPTTIKIALANLPAILVWVISLFFICRRLAYLGNTATEKLIPGGDDSAKFFVLLSLFHKRKVFVIGLTKKVSVILILLVTFFSFFLVTRSHREACQPCFDFWHKVRLGKTESQFSLIPSKEILLKGLDHFPETRLLAKVQIRLPNSAVLDSVSISAIDRQGNDLGNWTSQPTDYLWGVGVLDNAAQAQISNYGPRAYNLKLPISRNLFLVIPDNGNLSKRSNLYIQIHFNDGSRVSTLAIYND